MSRTRLLILSRAVTSGRAYGLRASAPPGTIDRGERCGLDGPAVTPKSLLGCSRYRRPLCLTPTTPGAASVYSSALSKQQGHFRSACAASPRGWPAAPWQSRPSPLQPTACPPTPAPCPPHRLAGAAPALGTACSAAAPAPPLGRFLSGSTDTGPPSTPRPHRAECCTLPPRW